MFGHIGEAVLADVGIRPLSIRIWIGLLAVLGFQLLLKSGETDEKPTTSPRTVAISVFLGGSPAVRVKVRQDAKTALVTQ